MKHLLYILLFPLTFAACKFGDQENKQPDSDVISGLPEGFEAFYKQFHRDSLFQIDHITFPLQGIPDFADSLETDKIYYWEQEEWVMHRELDLEAKGYTREIKSLGYVVEEVIRNDENFGTIRRFYFSDGKWKLIYYVGINLLPEK